MNTLSPKTGFDWNRLSWGGPDEPVSEICSYCDAPIDDDEVPLMMWNAEGWMAQFCYQCQATWWGVVGFE